MTVLRGLGAVSLLLAGAATAVAAVAVHTLWWGLPLVVVGLLAALGALGPGWLTRLPFALGFVGGVAVAVLPRAEGDVVVTGGGPGWLLLLVALLTLVVAVTTLPRPRRGDESGSAGQPT